MLTKYVWMGNSFVDQQSRTLYLQYGIIMILVVLCAVEIKDWIGLNLSLGGVFLHENVRCLIQTRGRIKEHFFFTIQVKQRWVSVLTVSCFPQYTRTRTVSCIFCWDFWIISTFSTDWHLQQYFKSLREKVATKDFFTWIINNHSSEKKSLLEFPHYSIFTNNSSTIHRLWYTWAVQHLCVRYRTC